MFEVKYVAQNDLTGIQIKTFRTKFFAIRWMKRPIKLVKQKFSKSEIFINLYEVV